MSTSGRNRSAPDQLLTVIVPTRDEAQNVAPLVARCDAALARYPGAEILFVDDSDDSTPDMVQAVARTTDRQVRLLHREPAERTGGLGSAVAAGITLASGHWVVVMDGDLQHPPEVIPTLVETGQEAGADVVVASRYCGAGHADGLTSAGRRGVSRAATAVTRLCFPRQLAGCSDPMSGFFAVRASSVDLSLLRPDGFKILLEILATHRALTIREVPFKFAERHAGTSKASAREGLALARRLVALRAAAMSRRLPPRVARMGGFAAVGASGIIINSLALWFFTGVLGWHLAVGATLATQTSTLWNFLLIDRWVYRGSKQRSGWARLLGFLVVNNVTLLVRLPVLAWLVSFVGLGYLLANLLTLLGAFIARFLLSDRYLFTAEAAMKPTPDRTHPDAQSPAPHHEGPVDLVVDVRPGRTTRWSTEPLPYHYDVHGILTIASAVRLKELDHFGSPTRANEPDIEIRRGEVGTGRPRARARVTQFVSPAAVSYQEHLGRHGADFMVEMASQTRVTVGPMLCRSPHVLYTNVVEALLRFVLVSRGYMLLHSACLALDGRGIMLSARTDTGKTGTVLRVLREQDARFLSDDMTILGPNGMALAFPKPLTISQHTLRAVDAGDLSPKEWRRLRVQSRLHSKEGRAFGARLGMMNLPIMSVNALTQCVIPPPKYAVERLVRCRTVDRVRVSELFVIERGPVSVTPIPPERLLDELIENTDDAYGFPPFRYFAPALVVGGDNYDVLRVKERNILASAMSGVNATRMATPDFSWADRLPLAAQPSVVDLRDVDATAPEHASDLDDELTEGVL